MDTTEYPDLNHTLIYNTSDTEAQLTLTELNDEAARIYYGANIFLGILILPGVVGNLHVLHIFIYKKPHNNTRVYVIFLAIIDLLACAVVFPFNIVNCLLPYLYHDDVSCKIFTFLRSCVAIGSANALLVIAIERYQKICCPFKYQPRLRYAKLSCVIAALVTCVASFPVLFMFGSTRIPTSQLGYYGYECHYVTDARGSDFQIIYNFIIMIVGWIESLVMIVLYSLIGCRLWKQRKRLKRKRQIHKVVYDTAMITKTSNISTSDGEYLSENNDDNETMFAISNNERIRVIDQGKYLGTTTVYSNDTVLDTSDGVELDREPDTDGNIPTTVITTNKHTHKPKRKIHQTNYTFFLITLCFLVSYISYPVLRIYQHLNMDWYRNLDFTSLVIFHTALCLVFINNVVNCFIYAICDRLFRQEIKLFYMTLYRNTLTGLFDG